MVLIIDNYDSFSYNLFQYIGEINSNIKVVRNDELTVAEIDKLNPTHIVISPGPGKPSDAGVSIDVIKQLHTKYPILGVCLGHQGICEAFGATVSYAKALMHGKSSVIKIEQSKLFDTLGDTLKVARYHSLSAVEDTMPSDLRVIAVADDGEIMAVEHVSSHTYGVQFHPESILTENGKTIIKNFLGITL